jgi:hypothetical protein
MAMGDSTPAAASDKFAWIDAFVMGMNCLGVSAEPWQLVDMAEDLYETWWEYHPALVAKVERQLGALDDEWRGVQHWL